MQKPIWLASYPRSGNTYLRTILFHCFGLRSASIYPNDLGTNEYLQKQVGHIEHIDGKIQFPPGTKFPVIKTHEVPPDNNPTIYLVRNGYDATLSLHDWLDNNVDLSDIIIGKQPFSLTWSRHLEAWHPWNRPNTLFLRFEEITTDLPSLLKQLSTFLNLPILSETVPSRDQIAAKDGKWIRAQHSHKSRIFTSKQRHQFNHENAAMMKQLGYPLVSEKLTHQQLPVVSHNNKEYLLGGITSTDNLKDFFRMIRPVAITTPLIRIGEDNDGGYLVPDDLDLIQACFSPGVSDICQFEEDLAERGIKSFMTDYSVEAAPVENPLFHFKKRHLGLTNDSQTIRLYDWVNQEIPEAGDDLVLQMDIEGAEYQVLLDTPADTLRRFRIVVIEFHGLTRLFASAIFTYMQQAFRRLTDNFEVVHMHPNNCCPVRMHKGFEVPDVLECTFYRKDRAHAVISDAQLAFPHALDAPNVPHKEDIKLPTCWSSDEWQGNIQLL
ncbi:sulfotransferase domain-containing protein [Solemya velum gill symbiont]|uniref:sulfotransferase domain-containing protein n=1 Tax=Solemya velum gill symbiont TaxID=2340 RepID=UPI000996B576|nr:sulfotransferase domain-containing protein [Solemya velum gill symbiont]